MTTTTSMLARGESNNSKTLFLRRFLKHGKRVASIAPSSPALARATTEHVTSDRAQTILELGAGTGAITKVALEKMHPGSRLIAVEIDPAFADVLERECPQVEVIRADVRDLDRRLSDLQVDHIDLLINGLPTPSLPKALNTTILDAVAKRSRGATFSQITVMPWVYQGMYARVFDEVKFRLVTRNLPPGGVYHCTGLKPDYARNPPGV